MIMFCDGDDDDDDGDDDDDDDDNNNNNNNNYHKHTLFITANIRNLQQQIACL